MGFCKTNTHGEATRCRQVSVWVERCRETVRMTLRHSLLYFSSLTIFSSVLDMTVKPKPSIKVFSIMYVHGRDAFMLVSRCRIEKMAEVYRHSCHSARRPAGCEQRKATLPTITSTTAFTTLMTAKTRQLLPPAPRVPSPVAETHNWKTSYAFHDPNIARCSLGDNSFAYYS